MHFSTSLLAAALAAGSANAGYQGFNTGAFFLNNQAKVQADFAYEFNKAQNLPGTSGWNAARLYTMVQYGTAADPISAIPAAIETNTKLLLGVWASGGAASVANEITALKTAISQYGTSFTNLVVGISVGSEDLYRDSEGGLNGVGISAAPLIDYISQVRSAISGTTLASAPVGHVDTWTAWVNGSNTNVISAVDFLGFDGYPYWQTTIDNGIANANATFYDSLDRTIAVAQGKPVWVTETGWPVSGPTQNLAVASAENARIYWQDVACSLVSKGVHLFWYILQESQWGTASPDFGLYPAGDLNQVTPNFDFSC